MLLVYSVGGSATNFLVVVLFLGLSEVGVLSCFWSFSFSFSSCAISFCSCLFCWSMLGFGVVIGCAFCLVDHVDAGEVADGV